MATRRRRSTVTLNEAKRVLPKNRLTDVLVKRGGRVFKAKAKYDPKLGRVRVFVNPRVAKAAGVANPYDSDSDYSGFGKYAYSVYWGINRPRWPMANGYYRTRKEAEERAKLERRKTGYKYAVKKVEHKP